MRRIRRPARRFSQFSMKLHVITISMMRDFATIAIEEKENEFFEKFSSKAIHYDGELNF